MASPPILHAVSANRTFCAQLSPPQPFPVASSPLPTYHDTWPRPYAIVRRAPSCVSSSTSPQWGETWLPRLHDGSVLHTGKVSRDGTLDQGTAARQARAAVGMAGLPRTRGVDVAMMVEVAAARAGGRFQVPEDRGCPPLPAGEGWRVGAIVGKLR